MDVAGLDGLSLVLGALAAGGADGTRALASDAVLSARDRLAEMVRNRLGGRVEDPGPRALDAYIADPNSSRADSLRAHLIAAGLDDDLIALARGVFEAGGPTVIGPGGIAGTAIATALDGGHAHVGGIQNYNSPPTNPR